jgi:hypothetical protein
MHGSIAIYSWVAVEIREKGIVWLKLVLEREQWLHWKWDKILIVDVLVWNNS